MLQRLTTLASQSANGTYNTVARGNLQSEVEELLKEIDRIANNTDFNGIKPLAATGGAGKMTFQIGPSAAETITVNSQAMTASGIQAAIFQDAVDRGVQTYKVGSKNTIDISSYGENDFIDEKGGIGEKFEEILKVGDNTGTKSDVALQTPAGKALSKAKAASAMLPSMNISGTSTVVANAAIDTINAAINAVSSYRAKLGAAQNRLEHTVNNLKVTSENITSAESRIRDTDMADEITAFTKNNILLQASQSMLAQSNSVPQSILSLLQ